MRFALTFSLACVTSIVLFGCNKAASRGEKPAPSNPRARSNAVVVSGWVVDSSRTGIPPTTAEKPAAVAEHLILADDTIGNAIQIATSAIDTTITLGAWLKSHPTDKVSEIAPVSGVDDPFCRAAVARMRIAGRDVTRSALFYIPAPPRGEKLPTDTARLAEDFCELRTVLLSTEETDALSATAFADTLGRLIESRLGSHKTGLELGAGGMRMGAEGETWKRRGTTVVLAVAPIEQPENWDQAAKTAKPATSLDTTRRRVAIVAYAPGSGIDDFDSWQARYDERATEDAKGSYGNADSAMAWADLPAISADLRTVLAYVRRPKDKPDSVRNPQVDAALFRALKATHDIAPSLKAPRRAAALLAADIVLFAVMPGLSADSTSPVLRALTSLGITFDELPESSVDRLNTRPWLWQAYRLDSLGRAGHAAFIELLSQGWTTRGACKEGSDLYARIIQHGELALRRGDSDPSIHYYVGSAYKTIYDMANHGSSEYIDSNAYKAQREPARLKGIEHFRLALESLPDRPMRHLAWTKAMRLLLRRSGEQPEYLCFDD